MYRFVVFLLCVCFFNFGFLSATEISSKVEKTEDVYKLYVDQSQIYFIDNKIFISIENILKEVNFIVADAKGIYCAIKVKGYPKSWDCPVCAEHNNDREYCKVCGYWPAGPK